MRQNHGQLKYKIVRHAGISGGRAMRGRRTGLDAVSGQLGGGFDAEFPRRAHDGVRRTLVKAFERTHRREDQWQPQPPSEPFDGGVDPAHVPQHARPKRDLVEGEAGAAASYWLLISGLSEAFFFSLGDK
jgi:hypothetical protein